MTGPGIARSRGRPTGPPTGRAGPGTPVRSCRDGRTGGTPRRGSAPGLVRGETLRSRHRDPPAPGVLVLRTRPAGPAAHDPTGADQDRLARSVDELMLRASRAGRADRGGGAASGAAGTGAGADPGALCPARFPLPRRRPRRGGRERGLPGVRRARHRDPAAGPGRGDGLAVGRLVLRGDAGPIGALGAEPVVRAADDAAVGRNGRPDRDRRLDPDRHHDRPRPGGSPADPRPPGAGPHRTRAVAEVGIRTRARPPGAARRGSSERC